MENIELKKLIALVFIKGKEQFPMSSNKTVLAKGISKSLSPKINYKSLLNYFEFFFEGKESVNPNNDTINVLLQFLGYDTQLKFIENQPKDESYLDEVPFVNYKKNEDSFEKENEVDKEEEIKSSESDKNHDIFIDNSIEHTPLENTQNHVFSNKSVTRNRNSSSITVITIVAIVAIVVSGFFFYSNRQSKNDICGYWEGDKYIEVPCDAKKQGIQIQTINIKEVNINTFRKVVPTPETEFFNKQNNQPIVWYAVNNGQTEFFNSQGKHPISGVSLKPVTTEVVNAFYHIEKEEIEPEKKVNAITQLKDNSTSLEASFFNQSVINTKSSKEIGLFIFDSIQHIDNSFMNHLKNELSTVGYKVTPNLIFSSKLNLDVIERLKAFDFKYFNDEFQKHTDYICVASVRYSFSKNTIRADMITCRLQIDYNIVSVFTGEIKESYSNVIIGNGFSKISAKNNTIKKFKI